MAGIFAPFFITIALGCLWGPLARRIASLPSRETARDTLSAVVFHFFLPALTFHVIFQAPIGRDTWAIPAVSALTCLITLGLAWLGLSLLQRFSGRKLAPASLGALLLAAAWSNATYLGLPIVTELFGEEARRVAILFDLFALTPLLLTVGTGIGARLGQARGDAPRANVASLVPIGAALLALALRWLQAPVPDSWLKACALLGQAVSPMMIFTVGLSLRPGQLRRAGWTLPAAVLKLAVAPIVAGLLARALGLEGLARHASTVEAAMPSMVLTLVVAERTGLDVELLAIVVAATTALSFVTIPWIASLPL
jgi:predicted permease